MVKNLTLAALCTGVFAIFVGGCQPCANPACGESLSVELRPQSGENLPPGAYRVSTSFDGYVVESTCIVSTEEGSTKCEDPVVQGISPFVEGYDVWFQVSAELISVSIWRRVGDDTSGPASFAIALDADDVAIFERELEPTYEKVEYRGPGCGWCDKRPVDRWQFMLPK